MRRLSLIFLHCACLEINYFRLEQTENGDIVSIPSISSSCRSRFLTLILETALPQSQMGRASETPVVGSRTSSIHLESSLNTHKRLNIYLKSLIDPLSVCIEESTVQRRVEKNDFRKRKERKRNFYPRCCAEQIFKSSCEEEKEAKRQQIKVKRCPLAC